LSLLRIPWREPLEFVILFAAAAVALGLNVRLGSAAQNSLLVGVAVWAGCKTMYYFAETLRHLLDSTAQDVAYHRFLALIAYNMAQITLSYAVDFYCLYQIDRSSLSGIDPALRGAALFFECFYFSVLNFSFFGYGDITPTNVPAKVVMLLEVVTAFSTVIFLLSDFVCMKESMRRK